MPSVSSMDSPRDRGNGLDMNGAGQIVSGLSPAGSYAIGQYFKNNDAQNRQDGGNLEGEGSTPHLIAHGLLSAEVSYATRKWSK